MYKITSVCLGDVKDVRVPFGFLLLFEITRVDGFRVRCAAVRIPPALFFVLFLLFLLPFLLSGCHTILSVVFRADISANTEGQWGREEEFDLADLLQLDALPDITQRRFVSPPATELGSDEFLRKNQHISQFSEQSCDSFTLVPSCFAPRWSSLEIDREERVHLLSENSYSSANQTLKMRADKT